MSDFRFHSRPLQDAQRWGNWRLNVSNRTLVYADGRYEIDLEGVDGIAELADWVFQLNGKTWCSAEDVGNLVKAFDDIFYPQANLCSGGQSKEFDPKAYLDKLFDTAEVR